jgi:hypothetical protein
MSILACSPLSDQWLLLHYKKMKCSVFDLELNECVSYEFFFSISRLEIQFSQVDTYNKVIYCAWFFSEELLIVNYVSALFVMSPYVFTKSPPGINTDVTEPCYRMKYGCIISRWRYTWLCLACVCSYVVHNIFLLFCLHMLLMWFCSRFCFSSIAANDLMSLSVNTFVCFFHLSLYNSSPLFCTDNIIMHWICMRCVTCTDYFELSKLFVLTQSVTRV